MRLWLSRVSKPFRLFLTNLDRSLVYVATPFGVRVTESRKRYAILLGIYAVIYLLGALPIPVLPLVALTIGYVGVLAVGRAWVLNEKERSLVAKKLKNGNPDEMPDLRWTALLSALQLIILFPLIFMQVQRRFGLYTVPDGTGFWGWVGFTLDSYNKAFLNSLEVYGVHVHHIDYQSTWGRHLMMLCRVTFDFLLIQGVVRLLAIRETVRDAVAAVATDPDMAIRVGKRSVPLLIASLRDRSADWKTRSNAAEALSNLEDPRAVEPLIAALHDTEAGVRSSAAKALGWLKKNPPGSDEFDWKFPDELPVPTRAMDPRAVAPLIRALQDTEAEVRSAAAEALSRSKDPRAVDALIAACRHTDEHVRSFAFKAACGLKDARAVQALVAALGDTDANVRVQAARALGELKDPEVVTPLIAALKDTEERVRSAVAEALGELKDPRVVEPFMVALQDRDANVRVQAARALAELKDLRASAPLLVALQGGEAPRSAAAQALGRLKEPRAAGPLIAALQDKEADVRSEAATALGELKDPGAVEPLIAALQDPAMGSNAVFSVRSLAAEALGKLKDPRAVEPLIAALHDPDMFVRGNAAKALGAFNDPRMVEPLIAALQDESDDVRSEAAYALGCLKDSRAVGPLIAALKDPDILVPINAAAALGELKDPRAVEPLIAALQNPEPLLRAAASEALGKLQDQRAVEPLYGALRDGVGFEAVVALGKLKDPRAVEPLISGLQASDAEVRNEAAQALGNFRDPRAVEPLIAALQDSDAHVRSWACGALATSRDPRAVEPLIGALHDNDEVLRYWAAVALGQLKDPRAVAPLRAALQDANTDVRSAAAAALVGAEWYYTRDNERLGPVTMEQLMQLASTNKLGGTDLIWKDGMPSWAPANSVLGIFGGSNPAAAPAAVAPTAAALHPAPVAHRRVSKRRALAPRGSSGHDRSCTFSSGRGGEATRSCGGDQRGATRRRDGSAPIGHHDRTRQERGRRAARTSTALLSA